MQKHLILTGPTGVGKSTLLRRLLGERLSEAGGFVTEADLGSYGELTGFSLSPAASAGGVSGFVTERFLDCTHFPPQADNEVYRSTGVRLLQEARWYPFAMLDEFGGFELIIPQFRTALLDLLHSDLPILGVLKIDEEAEALRQALGLGEKYKRYSHELRRYLAQDPDTLVIRKDDREDLSAISPLTAWIQEYLS